MTNINDISPLCRQMRHTACHENSDTCACQHHRDDEFAGVAEAAAEIARNAAEPGRIGRAAERDPIPVTAAAVPAPGPQREVSLRDEIKMNVEAWQVRCPDPLCSSGPFKSEHAARIHWSKGYQKQPWPVGRSIDVPATPAVETPAPEVPAMVAVEADIEPDAEEADTISITVDGVSPHALDVLAALEYLDARPFDDLVNEALDEWATRATQRDDKIRLLVSLRRERRPF